MTMTLARVSKAKHSDMDLSREKYKMLTSNIISIICNVYIFYESLKVNFKMVLRFILNWIALDPETRRVNDDIPIPAVPHSAK